MSRRDWSHQALTNGCYLAERSLSQREAEACLGGALVQRALACMPNSRVCVEGGHQELGDLPHGLRHCCAMLSSMVHCPCRQVLSNKLVHTAYFKLVHVPRTRDPGGPSCLVVPIAALGLTFQVEASLHLLVSVSGSSRCADPHARRHTPAPDMDLLSTGALQFQRKRRAQVKQAPVHEAAAAAEGGKAHSQEAEGDLVLPRNNSAAESVLSAAFEDEVRCA